MSATPGQPVSKRELRLVFAGLMLALTLAALDQNIVGPALPRIVSDLGGLAHMSWVVTAFLLASTATTPLYGKLSDTYGRKPLFVIAITIFLAGSALCGFAETMMQLVLFRGVQGLGAGGLLTLAQTTVADVVAPRDRGRYQGLFSGVFAVCSVAGPLLGGIITDAWSWRWIFFVNVPVGAAALLLISVGLKRHARPLAHRIDYWGAVALTAGTSAVLLVLSWGGTVYPWLSAPVVALAVVAAVFFGLLVRIERAAPEPLLPPRLFRCKVFVVSSVVLGLTAMALFSTIVFIPLYFQLVLGKSPSEAGLMMAPQMGGVIVASIVGGRLVSTTGRYKLFPVAGLAAATVAFLTMAWAATSGAGAGALVASLVALGLGIGLVMPTLTVAIQNAVERADLGVATSAASFFRALGSAVGVAVAGAVMTLMLHRLLPGAISGPAGSSESLLDQGVQQIASLPPAEREAVIAAYRHAITATFLVGAVVAGLAFLAALVLPELPLKGSRAEEARQSHASEEACESPQNA
jgi:EmrB/QacA subfamily drug resistance transporter